MLNKILQNIQVWRWRRKYRPGRIVTRFIAKDIRRDVEVIDTTDIAEGVITCRTRTWNVLYTIHGMKEKPPFGDARRLEIGRMWDWAGEPWGGPVPDSTDRKA